MVLVHTIGDAAIPDGTSANLCQTSVTFYNKKIVHHKTKHAASQACRSNRSQNFRRRGSRAGAKASIGSRELKIAIPAPPPGVAY
jgi:predicted amino acid racemase